MSLVHVDLSNGPLNSSAYLICDAPRAAELMDANAAMTNTNRTVNNARTA